MPPALRGPVSFLGRLLLCSIFFMAAAGNKIPDFNKVADEMMVQIIPYPEAALVGAIVFLIIGSVSVMVGFKARFGALLLFLFLVPATVYFHDFWNKSEGLSRNM